jgi:hypothetical protein
VHKDAKQTFPCTEHAIVGADTGRGFPSVPDAPEFWGKESWAGRNKGGERNLLIQIKRDKKTPWPESASELY